MKNRFLGQNSGETTEAKEPKSEIFIEPLALFFGEIHFRKPLSAKLIDIFYGANCNRAAMAIGTECSLERAINDYAQNPEPIENQRQLFDAVLPYVRTKIYNRGGILKSHHEDVEPNDPPFYRRF